MIKTVWCVTFYVSDLKRTARFYEETLGLEKKYEYYRELKNKGVNFIKELHKEPWGGKQATFTDPDGNILEIAQINWKKYFAVSAEGAKKKA